MENKETKELYEFGGFQLDVRNHRLLKNSEIISLTSKEFEVLLMLVNHAGEVVGKNALLDKVWTDTFVEEGTLTRNISWLRKKLAPDGEKIIETVPRLGYRLAPEVRKVPKPPIMIFEEQINQKITIEETFYIEDQTSPTIPLQLQPKGKNKYFWWAVVLGVLLIASISVFTFLYLRNSTTKTIILSKSIPFSGLSGRENMPSFSPDGKQITFVWDADLGNFDIYTKLIGTGEPLRLTRAPENDFFPVFSPDGKSIAFIRNYLNKSEVFLIPALGGVERKICELNSISSSLAFSTDGKTLSVIDSDADKQQFGIFLVDIETGKKKTADYPAGIRFGL